MRAISLLGVLVIANFATVGLGLPLGGEGGKFSGSNVMPILFVVAGAAQFFVARSGRVNTTFVWFLLLFNTSAFLSFAIFLLRFSWQPNYAVLLFQDVELVFSLLLLWYGCNNPEEFRRTARIGIWVCAGLMAGYAWSDLTSGYLRTGFGMDDKSHTAVILACEAYILIRFYGTFIDTVLALALVALSLLTMSRLPIFFLPGIFLALIRHSRYGSGIALAIGCASIAVALIAGDAIALTFKVFDRLSSLEAIAGEDSTSTHLLLIKNALDIKFSDPISFLFGIGPGNFSKALASIKVSLAEIEAVDPVLVSDVRLGKAPMHSTPVSMFLDYNIAIFLCVFCAAIQMLRKLAAELKTEDGLFLVGFLIASMFYSLHNKPYFYLMLTALGVLWLARQRGQLLRDTNIILRANIAPRALDKGKK